MPGCNGEARGEGDVLSVISLERRESSGEEIVGARLLELLPLWSW
jgi:hypothetical protein